MAELRTGQFFGGVSGRWAIPQALLTRLDHAAVRKVPSHTHERGYLNLVLTGHYREQTRLRKIEYQPFTLVSHPAHFEHRDEIGDGGAQFFIVEFRGDWLDRRQAQFDIQGGEAVWAALRLACRVHDGPLAAEAGVAELLGALNGGRWTAEKREPRWLTAVEDRLREEFLSPPALEILSGDAGVHPVHLSRTYRKFRGEGAGDFVRRLRVIEGARRIATGGQKLVDIAAELGFADQSHFARSFKQVTGVTAGEFQRQVAKTRR
ncbi:MAG: helix-turn-helix transcriptional regulator [Bryobacterales bacterium]|nr:helix-turn-helix transcriptional regulator [Bryobacterales bacterium]